MFACPLPLALANAIDWQQPTPQELSMTAEPAAPGAAAIYLYREQVDDNFTHAQSIYVRLKVLTEAGRTYGNIEIPYAPQYLDVVEARTIHPDGTIVPYAGKPLEKMVEGSTSGYRETVIAMPAVEVGSILEYKYRVRFSEWELSPPAWFIQKSLYIRRAHYQFLPYDGAMTMTAAGAGLTKVSTLHWYPVLPQGVEVQRVKRPHSWSDAPAISYVLDLEHIPPVPDEDYLPPAHSLTYRVYFQYLAYSSGDEFWSKEGKYWSKEADRFMGPGQRVKALVGGVTLPADAPEGKLRKLYAEVMSYENTDFTRERSAREEKAEGLRAVKTADDIVSRKRGSSDELTMLFVAMARAAGMKAYLMRVTSREEELFDPNLLSMRQLDSSIAIVDVDGKDKFFDPGERYCPYGQLRWDHTVVSGVRQTENGTEIAQTPQANFEDAKTVRVAKLTMDDAGQFEGTIQIGYSGDPALAWRQLALFQDETEVETEMEKALRNTLPAGLTVKLDKVSYLADPSRQLVSSFHVQGALAGATAKRMFVPLCLFEASKPPRFIEPKRDLPVYFHYGYQDIDQVSITYPRTMELESTPPSEEVKMEQLAVLHEGSLVKDNTVTLSRKFVVGAIIFKPSEYEELRTFYGKVAQKDREQAVFKLAGHAVGN